MIRALGVAAFLAAAGVQVHADMNDCVGIGAYAENIMKHRQDGVKMSLIMSTMEGMDDEHRAFAESIAISAYEKTRYPAGEYRDQAIENFRNDVELICYRNKAQRKSEGSE